MTRLPMLLATLALLLPTTAFAQGPSGPSPVNAIAGDESWIDAHGRAPTAEEDRREHERLVTHLAWVERTLRARDVSHLSPALRARRARLLDALARYRAKGAFPRNEAYPSRRPRFVDDQGRTCAVGHLIEVSEGRALTEAIDARFEYDYLLDMRDEALSAWVARSGFSAKELAMVQPSYGFLPVEPPPVIEPVEPPPTTTQPRMTRRALRSFLRGAGPAIFVNQCVAQHGQNIRRLRVGVWYGRRGIRILTNARSTEVDRCVRGALRPLIQHGGYRAPARGFSVMHTFRPGRGQLIGPPSDGVPYPALPLFGARSAS